MKFCLDSEIYHCHICRLVIINKRKDKTIKLLTTRTFVCSYSVIIKLLDYIK